MMAFPAPILPVSSPVIGQVIPGRLFDLNVASPYHTLCPPLPLPHELGYHPYILPAMGDSREQLLYTDRYGVDGWMPSGIRRKNATRETTNALKAWLSDHRKNPYPTKGEKIMLAIITKMTLTQVSTWFANARRRLKKENKGEWIDQEDDDDEVEKYDVENTMKNDAKRVTSKPGDDVETRTGCKSRVEGISEKKTKIWSLAETATSDKPPKQNDEHFKSEAIVVSGHNTKLLSADGQFPVPGQPSTTPGDYDHYSSSLFLQHNRYPPLATASSLPYITSLTGNLLNVNRSTLHPDSRMYPTNSLLAPSQSMMVP